jgi:hypothetical protein
MLEAFWTWLREPANQQTLGWIGGGLVVVIGGVWAVVKFFAKKESGASAAQSVRADMGGVAAGRDISNNQIYTNFDKENLNKGRKPGP